MHGYMYPLDQCGVYEEYLRNTLEAPCISWIESLDCWISIIRKAGTVMLKLEGLMLKFISL